MDHDYSYYRELTKNRSFPIALVDMDLLDKNITLIQNQAQGLPIRIASKSVRCRYLTDYIKHKLKNYAGIMTYHGKEAIWLSQHTADHLLIAYPVVDVSILQEIGQAMKEGKKITLMVDHPEHIHILEKVGKQISVIFSICLDIDLAVDFGPLHFGVWRSSIAKEKQLAEFLNQLKDVPHIKLEGLMGYEAQIAGVGDQVKTQVIKSAIIRFLKKRSLPKIQQWRAKAVELIKQHGHPLKFVNGGGTGSIQKTRQESDITEIAVGSGFYCSHLFDHYQDFRLHPAAFFASQIVRQPKPGVFTCHGGGYMASGGVEASKSPRIHLLAGARLDKNEGTGEVQTPVFYTGGQPLNIGDPIFFRHSKAGELCEHFNELHLIRGGKVEKIVKTYRGEGQSFL